MFLAKTGKVHTFDHYSSFIKPMRESLNADFTYDKFNSKMAYFFSYFKGTWIKFVVVPYLKNNKINYALFKIENLEDESSVKFERVSPWLYPEVYLCLTKEYLPKPKYEACDLDE